jgi:hypothetical protein
VQSYGLYIGNMLIFNAFVISNSTLSVNFRKVVKTYLNFSKDRGSIFQYEK